MLFRLLCLLRVLVLTKGLLDTTTTTPVTETGPPVSSSAQYVSPEIGQIEDIELNVTTSTVEEVPSPSEVSTSSSSSEDHISVVENVTEPVEAQPEEEVDERGDTEDDDGGDNDDAGNGDSGNENDGEGNANYENNVSVGNAVDNVVGDGNLTESDDNASSDGSVGNDSDHLTNNGATRLPFIHPGLIKHEQTLKKIMARGRKEPIKIKPRKVKYSRKSFYNYKSLKPKKVNDKCQCGDRTKANSHRIVNGEEAEPNFFPWMVSVTFAAYDIHFCGGTVICDKYILTAAHCTDGLSASDMSVRLGDHDLLKDDIGSAFTIDVAKIIMHKDYNPDTTNMDIALLKLKTKIDFKKTENVLPACLTPPDIAYYWENVIVPGWGNLHEDAQSTSPLLQFVELTVLGMNDCRNEYELFPSEVSQYMLCAYRRDHDACQGDSGGPLLYFDKPKNQYFQIGIVSWGIGCARPEFPGVYTKLSKIVGWVYDNTKDCTYCELSEPSNIKQGKREKNKIQNKKKQKNKKKLRKMRKKIVRNRKPARTGLRRVGRPQRKGRRRMAANQRRVVVRQGKPKRKRGRRQRKQYPKE